MCSDTVLLAAVSGGADSMAMLASLCALWSKERLFCLHVDHSLRPAESKIDAEFVAAFCKERGISCHVAVIPPGKIARFAKRRGTGIEAAARFFRRRAFFSEAARLGENVLILTAHTRDDLLETALMRVLRGSGPAGLASMPVRKGRLLRPLLSVTRAEVAAYLKAKNILWREDSTNTDEKLLRNRIRRRLIPLLDESFPSWKAALSGMAETQSLAASFLAEETQRRVVWGERRGEWGMGNGEWGAARLSGKTRPSLFTDADGFFAQAPIVREEAIFQGIDRLVSGGEGSASVKRAVVRQFCAGNVTAADFGPVTARREGAAVVLAVRKKERHESGFSLLIKEPGLYNLKKTGIEVRSLAAQNEEGAFTAALPLVFRRSFKDDFLVVRGRKKRGNSKDSQICALDVFGTAAFIGPRGLAAARECSGNGELFSVKISSNGSGGSDDKS